MRSISEKQHRTLVDGLQNLQEMLLQEKLEGTDSTQEIEESISMLLSTYQKYEHLLAQMTVMTEQYKKIHRHVRAKTLAPVLRALKKKLDTESPCYFLVREILYKTKNL